MFFSTDPTGILESFAASGSVRLLPSTDVVSREELALFEVAVGSGFTADSVI